VNSKEATEWHSYEHFQFLKCPVFFGYCLGSGPAWILILASDNSYLGKPFVNGLNVNAGFFLRDPIADTSLSNFFEEENMHF
jgi:hypothetical protein